MISPEELYWVGQNLYSHNNHQEHREVTPDNNHGEDQNGSHLVQRLLSVLKNSRNINGAWIKSYTFYPLKFLPTLRNMIYLSEQSYTIFLRYIKINSSDMTLSPLGDDFSTPAFWGVWAVSWGLLCTFLSLSVLSRHDMTDREESYFLSHCK